MKRTRIRCPACKRIIRMKWIGEKVFILLHAFTKGKRSPCPASDTYRENW